MCAQCAGAASRLCACSRPCQVAEVVEGSALLVSRLQLHTVAAGWCYACQLVSGSITPKSALCMYGDKRVTVCADAGRQAATLAATQQDLQRVKNASTASMFQSALKEARFQAAGTAPTFGCQACCFVVQAMHAYARSINTLRCHIVVVGSSCLCCAVCLFLQDNAAAGSQSSSQVVSTTPTRKPGPSTPRLKGPRPANVSMSTHWAAAV